jgi:hypothetical protein
MTPICDPARVGSARDPSLALRISPAGSRFAHACNTAQVSVPANNLQSKLYNLKVIDANAVQKFQFFVFKQFGRNSLASKHRNVVPLCSTYQQQTGSVPGVEGGLCRPRVDFYFCFLCRV